MSANLSPISAVPSDGVMRFGVARIRTPGYVPYRSPERQRRDEEFDAGLRTLEAFAARRPGTCFSQGEIANACGVSQQRISELEKSALKKIRALRGLDVRHFLQGNPDRSTAIPAKALRAVGL